MLYVGSINEQRAKHVNDWKNSILLSSVLLAGCASYRTEPLSNETSLLDTNAVQVAANSFLHSLLPSVEFNLSDGLSADEVAIWAVLGNPRLQVVRDRRGVAQSQVLQAGLLPNPSLSAGFEVPTGGNSGGKVTGYGLGLDWKVSALISRNARQDAATAHSDAVDLEVAWQEWQVAEAARLHFARLGFAEKQLSLSQKQGVAAAQFYCATKRGLELGIYTKPELSVAEIAMQTAREAELDALSAIKQERLALNRVLGVPPQTEILLNSEDWTFTKMPSIEGLMDCAMTNRLDLRALQLGYKSQESRVRAAVRSSFPKITLGLTGGHDTDGVKTLGAGIGIELPFFDRNQGEIAAERATRKQLADEYHARLFETRMDLARLLALLSTSEKKLGEVNRKIPLLKRQLAVLRQAQEAGQVNMQTVYFAEIRLFNQMFQQLELEQKQVDLGLALELASGRYNLMGEVSDEI